jgi:hypothetical protein
MILCSKRKNILFLTTRQWNPGDEFILRGCINIIKTITPQFNPIIFNRHPEIHPNARFPNPLRKFQKTLKGHTYWGPFIRVGAKDNSFIAQSNDPNIFSLLVVAGSPGWPNPASNNVYKYALTHNVPTVFLGIGTPYEDFTFEGLRRPTKDLLAKALVVTTRDSRLSTRLNHLGAIQLPCPALMSAESNRCVARVETIGFAIGHPSAYTQGIAPEVYELLRSAIMELKSRYHIKIVCHFYDELAGLQNDFGSDVEVCYSFDSQDYFSIFDSCDLVVGTRVHAIGAAASLGIPGVFIAHDQRADTVKGFLADIVDPTSKPQELLCRIASAVEGSRERSRKLAAHKALTTEEFQKLLLSNSFLSDILA